MYATRVRRRLGVRLAGANGFARGLFPVLALSVVLGSLLTACGIRDPSPPPTPAPPSVAVKVVDKILIPGAEFIIVDPRTHAVYVSDEEGTLSVVATSTHWAVKSIRLGEAPDALAFDSGAGRLYAAFDGRGRDFGTVLVIDTHSFEAVDTIRIGKGGSLDGLAVDPPTGRLFVVHDNELSVIDTGSRTVIRSMSIRKGADGVALDSDAGVAYVSGEQQVLAIDTKTLDVRDVIDVEISGRMTVDSTTGHVFLGDQAGSLTVIDSTTRKVVKTITVGGPYGPSQVVIDSSAGRGYVTGGSGQTIGVFDTKTLEVVEEIARPDGVEWNYWPLAVDPSTGLLYIGSQKSILVVARNSPE